MGGCVGRRGRKVRRGAKRVPRNRRLAKVDPSQLRDLAVRFALLGCEPRLRLLMALTDGPQNVTSLCEYLNLAQPIVSNHLMRMQYGGLVASVRDGRLMVYRLLPGGLRLQKEFLRSLTRKT